jgi:Phage integrase, N-terminal SAM-like domain
MQAGSSQPAALPTGPVDACHDPLADQLTLQAPPAPPARIPTFAALAEEWLKRHPHLRGIRPSTLTNYRSFVEHHLRPYFGDRLITAITPATVEDFIVAKLSPEGSTRYPGCPLSRPSLRVGLVALRQQPRPLLQECRPLPWSAAPRPD